MITAQIIQDLKARVLTIPQIQEVFMHPEGADIVEIVDGAPVYKGSRVTKYPAIVFLKDNTDSEFSDSGSNHRRLAFKAWVLVQCGNVENLDIWERILPNAVDAVMAKLDASWNLGTEEGYRIWCKVESGQQGYTTEPGGRVAWEEMRILVRYSVSV
jgi:hypothetical protein